MHLLVGILMLLIAFATLAFAMTLLAASNDLRPV